MFWSFLLLCTLAPIVLRPTQPYTPPPSNAPLSPLPPLAFPGVCGYLLWASPGSVYTGAEVGVVHAHGIDAVFSVLGKPCTLDEALRDAAANVELTARNVAAVLRIGLVRD